MERTIWWRLTGMNRGSEWTSERRFTTARASAVRLAQHAGLQKQSWRPAGRHKRFDMEIASHVCDERVVVCAEANMPKGFERALDRGMNLSSEFQSQAYLAAFIPEGSTKDVPFGFRATLFWACLFGFAEAEALVGKSAFSTALRRSRNPSVSHLCQRARA